MELKGERRDTIILLRPGVNWLIRLHPAASVFHLWRSFLL